MALVQHPSCWSPPARLRTLYGAALGLAGLDVRTVDADEAVRAGLVEAARENGMIARSGVTA